jgi:PhzF family phenazine biosynthesis protein
MSQLRLRTVDAFANQAFAGNPAAVVVLAKPASDTWMAALARELNLAETAFVSAAELADADFRLRWFTPAVEVDLCGHATLAAAHCLFADGVTSPVRFATRSGVLTVTQTPDGSLAMDFPSWPPIAIDSQAVLAHALGTAVEWTGRGGTNDVLAVVNSEAAVRTLMPDIAAIAAIDARGVIVTAQADADRPYDFVSRFFAPNVGVAEDPVTGSAHTVLAPFWAERLGKTSLIGLQVSTRSGLVGVQLDGDRVQLTGRAVTIIDGFLSDAASAG